MRKTAAALWVAGVLAGLALAGCGGGSDSGGSASGSSTAVGESGGSPAVEAVEEIVGYYRDLDGMQSECSGFDANSTAYLESNGQDCKTTEAHAVNPSAPICGLVSDSSLCVMFPSVAEELRDCRFKLTGTGGADGSFGQNNPTSTFAGTDGVYAAKTAGVEVKCGGKPGPIVYMGEVEGSWVIAELSELYL